MASAVSLWSTGMGGNSRRTRFSTPLIDPPPHIPLCLSVCLSLFVYISVVTLSASNRHTVHTNANLVQYAAYLSNMILFSTCQFLNNFPLFNKWIFSLCFWLADAACSYCPEVLLLCASVSFVSK